MTKECFDANCRQCVRLAEFLDQIGEEYPNYHARPVAPFGAKKPDLLIVGLAPGMHGANATGRPFTGDHAGILLYETLFKYGFSSSAESLSADDGLKLKGCQITNAVKCLPPQNKPLTEEIKNCNVFLQQELAALKSGAVIIALGTIAHQAVIRALTLAQKDYRFSHAAEHSLPGERCLIDSYHCSRYNTQTRRLTESMFHQVFARAAELTGRKVPA